MAIMRNLVLPDGPGRIFESVDGWLWEHFSRENVAIGGGTVLAARWAHRRSTDCDMFADDRTFHKLDTDALRAGIDARIQSGELLGARQFRLSLFLETRHGELSLVGDRSRQRRHPSEHAAGVATHPTDEILRRKMNFRLLSRNIVAARDLYDFAVGACVEPDTMDRILWGMDESMGEWMEATLSRSEGIGSTKPILEPHCSELAKNLADFSAQLFRYGAAEFNRRHGNLIRRGLRLGGQRR